MKAPKYIENDIQTLIWRKIDYDKHKNSIRTVRCDPNLSAKRALEQVGFLQSLHVSRQAAIQRKEQIKAEDLYRQNSKIIVKIAQLKQEVQPETVRNRMNSARSSQSMKSAMKTRQREISLENRRMKHKIEHTQPSVPYLKCVKDFQKHQAEKERMSRASFKKQIHLREVISHFAPITSRMATNASSKSVVQTNRYNDVKFPRLNEGSQAVASLGKLRIGFSLQK